MRTHDQDGFDWLLVKGRWVVMLAALLTISLEHPHYIDQHAIFYVIVLIGLYNTILHYKLKKNPAQPWQRNVVLVVDLLFVTTLVYLSDGIRSPFFDVFYLVVIAAGVQRGIEGGLITAAVSAALVLGIEVVTEIGRTRIRDIDHFLSTIPYLFLVALAAGILSRQVTREAEQRRRAEVQSREMELEQERIRREMEVARDVQAALIPTVIPKVPGLIVAAKTVPARDIGGDLYDFDVLQSGSLVVSIIDISGKGIPAALALSGLKSGMDTYRPFDLIELLAMLNRYMIDYTPDEMFATMAICKFNPHNGKLQVASAGHEPVIIVRGATGDTELISVEGLPLGVSADTEYSISEATIESGDLVVMYTDGVTDARCGEKPLDISGVVEVSAQNVCSGPSGVVDALFGRIELQCDVIDDATIVVVGREEL